GLRRHKHSAAGIAAPRRPVDGFPGAQLLAVKPKLVADEHVPGRGVCGEGLRKRRVTHLRRHALVVATAVRTEHDAAVPPLGRPRRALTCATRALLTPRLRAAAGRARAIPRRARALPRVRERREERLEPHAATLGR